MLAHTVQTPFEKETIMALTAGDIEPPLLLQPVPDAPYSLDCDEPL